jgi:hypothetical protein
MRKLILSAMLLAAAAVSAQNGAMMEFKLSSSMGADGTIKSYYSGGNSRVEMALNVPQMPAAGFNRTSIVKSAEPTKSYQLDDQNKTYRVTEVKPASKESADEYTVKVIGKDKVAGYGCIHVQVTKGAEVTDFWTTKEIADYDKYAAKSDNKYMGSGSMYEALKKQNAEGFVVKSFMKDSRGGDFTMELVKIEKKDLAASLFTIPDNYKPAPTANVPPSAQSVDINKIQNMTPEEREKYIEEMKKQYQNVPH